MTDDPLPSSHVTAECVGDCGMLHRVVWPPRNPEAVEIRCSVCETDLTVTRDGEVVGGE